VTINALRWCNFVIKIRIEILRNSNYERNSVNTEYRTQVYMTLFAQNVFRNELHKWRLPPPESLCIMKVKITIFPVVAAYTGLLHTADIDSEVWLPMTTNDVFYMTSLKKLWEKIRNIVKWRIQIGKCRILLLQTQGKWLKYERFWDRGVKTTACQKFSSALGDY
jgi:hypothetical protein